MKKRFIAAPQVMRSVSRFVPSRKRLMMLSALVLVASISVQAQDEIETIKTQLATTNTSMRGTYIVVRNLIYVICGVIGLATLPAKYQKMQSGDPDAGKSLLNWGGALILVAAGAYILQLIFFAG